MHAAKEGGAGNRRVGAVSDVEEGCVKGRGEVWLAYGIVAYTICLLAELACESCNAHALKIKHQPSSPTPRLRRLA